jgi:hypothetical protein
MLLLSHFILPNLVTVEVGHPTQDDCFGLHFIESECGGLDIKGGSSIFPLVFNPLAVSLSAGYELFHQPNRFAHHSDKFE